MEKNFYITTTLPYVNAPLHMGHALEFVRADAYARYKKLQGYNVFFNTGTDEHGQKIYTKAVEKGQDPQVFVDESFLVFKKQVESFGITDMVHFIRTTDEHHIKAAQEFWRRVDDNGFIYKKNYQAKYCIGCEQEKTDSELDENGFCLLHPGIPLEIINEENYFFKFSAFEKRLLDFYENKPHFVIPEFRFNEMKTFVKNGLQDFSISRLKEKAPWGVPVPGDDAQVMYVWFDALTNYISTLGWPENTEQFEKFWRHGNPTQYCGKDNNRFQSVMWQAMLMAADLPKSDQIVINGHITAEGGVKMSKSLGNGVDPLEVANEYGTDALRFFLLKEISSFEDSPFTIERFRSAYQAGLANGIGNLVSRVMTLSEKYIEKRVAELIVEDEERKGLSKFITDAFDKFDINLVCQMIWREISDLNTLISDEEVFKLIKIDESKAKKMLINYLSKLSSIAYELQPLLPKTSEEIIKIIKSNKKPEKPLFARLEK